uniref:Uncharacterized protein n=1 Tax=Acrobeloides nanus TaxID=290746 RepID=A0A914D6J2_9BILA
MADSKGSSGITRILITGVVVLGIVGILGVSIAILVKVINNNKKETVYITNAPVSEGVTSAPANMNVSSTANSATAHVSSTANGGTAYVSSTANSATTYVNSTANSATAHVSSTANGGTAYVSSTANSPTTYVSSTANSATAYVSSTANGGTAYVSSTANGATAHVSSTTNRPTAHVSSTTNSPTASNNNPLGVPPPPTLNPQDTNKTSAYKDFISLLKQNVNTTQDPCNDFWAYACGNIGNNQQSFGVLTDKNYRVMASQIANSNYVSNAPLPVQQAAHHYTQCVTDTANWNKTIGDGSIIIKKVQDFQNILNIPMPAISGQGSGKTLSPDVLGSALGYLSGQAYTNTLVSAIVDTNWKHPDTAPGYALYVDQSTLGEDNTYYQKPVAWQDYQPLYINTTFLQVSTLAKLMNPNYNPSIQDPLLRNQITQALYFEWSLANNYSTLDSVRRHYNRSYNPMTILEASAAYPFINWANFLDQLLVFAPPEVRSYALNDTKFKFIIMEPVVLQKIQTDMNDSQGAFGSQQTFINWLYIRLLQTNSMYIPVPEQSFVRKSVSNKQKHSLLSKRPKVKAPTLPTFHPFDSITDDTGYNGGCMDDNVFGIQYANARLFIDGLYPNQADRDVLRNNVAQFVTLILDSFQSMLNQLGWMDQSSKQGAYAKISNLVKNMAYPDFITNDTSLIAYYKNLTFSLTDDYVTISENVNQFNQYLNFALLDKNKVVNRIDFLSAPGTVNAWYQPELNSISFPVAILQKPFYDPNYPAAVNYGAMGLVGGHELTHAFDDEGVQWGPTGALNTWMDKNSSRGFQTMADCVINEYNHFCPLDNGTFCIDGSQTQGENIADNGGIRSAYRAYQSHVALYGSDPQLPDPEFGGYTNDQLFFLSFAQVWCQSQPTDDRLRTQILVDPHSPSEYRVFGTIQNFPQFRAAFNCPVGSKYAPNNSCQVWTSEVIP